MTSWHEANEILETDDFVVINIGEDPEDSADSSKPVRLLRDFSFFDAAAPMEMRSLDLLGDGTDAAAPACNMQGTGVVFPTFEDDEDEGQEDDDEDEEFQDIWLPDLLRYSFDYLKEDDPVYVETENAFYLLQGPSRRYRRYFREFYKPLRILQAVLSTAFQTPEQEYHDFLKYFSKLTALDQALSEGDPWPVNVCPTRGNCATRNSSVIYSSTNHPRFQDKDSGHQPLITAKTNRNPASTKLASLHVAKLAAGLFKEELGVIGPPPKKCTASICDTSGSRQGICGICLQSGQEDRV
ncbi:hypothetical protein BJ138DRAFT_1119462 [Hygrophoropsis aurantiaca]|uniref:Uncharacterized protein n=1 Tax=Hygrophoropsis aurantiaca TaxID=72124 RepID=A0ACB7ZUN0_9AGAM|nr:hypothetical protein BJ138DRAFT_1119462 [Hygrophoropsis aurantiaca]